MINGKIKVTWEEKDYTKGPWRKNEDPYVGFNTRHKNKSLYNDIDIFINNNVHEQFHKILKKFKIQNPVLALNKMTPGQILPFHTDKYSTYCKKNKIKNKKNIIRIIVFLEDTKAGHQLWIEDKMCIGSAGSYFGWEYGTKHMAANLGEQDRYTLQITGVNE